MNPIVQGFLTGERLFLRGLREADADGRYPDWLNDAEVCEGNSHHVFAYGREAALSYIRSSQASRSELVLAIVRKSDQRHIGNIALQCIHPIYRSAELSILIGEKDAWGQGFGAEAAFLLCDHGFGALNLNRIACGTFHTNTSMKKLAISLGMQQEGIRRQAAFKSGTYLDIHEYGVLRHEYLAAKNKSLENQNDELSI